MESALGLVAQRIEPESLGIQSVVRLTGGASYETWAFDIKIPGGNTPLILRRMPVNAVTLSYSVGPEIEAQLMILAGAKEVPVPRVRYVLNSNDNLGRGFIASRVAGETLGRKIVRDAMFAQVRPTLSRACGAILARIHSITPPPLPCLDATPQLDSLYQAYREVGRRSAVFELAFRWLRERVPVPVPLKLLHGDFRNGNLIVASDGIKAVLDWELSHMGDPAEDLGWITVNSWRFGEINKPVGGFGTISELIEGYVAAGGAPITEERVRYWQTIGSLRWGIMCGKMAAPTDTGEPLPLERRMIGRRVTESEIDLLELIAKRATHE